MIPYFTTYEQSAKIREAVLKGNVIPSYLLTNIYNSSNSQ